ncbi:penicillin-binding protein 1A [Candidatus Vondammii sp. HM_W22]|uniref:penicillin-binding protein 1A n=1 Tax=Candidatus Vondammii sp. HM_W22 TaxID=2687299 RepID=UPI001F138564|nr:penicillin-binding protein 1A [Candidatus Vondammii sp. HM_W22]
MKWLIKSLKLLFWLSLIGGIAEILTVGGLYFYFEPQLPSTENLRNTKFQVPLRVYSKDLKLIAEFGEKRRIPLTYAEIPEPMVRAFLAAEDDRFFVHPGVDYQGLLRAAYLLITTGERRQGGSTITMQVARNFYLSREKTFARKFNEILLSLQIEKDLSKQEILALYLNKIYLGNRAYGVGAAAQVYYGKSVDQLTLEQTAMIAGLPKAPSKYNPLANPMRALLRRDYVLGRMAHLRSISEAERQAAVKEPVTASLHRAQAAVEAPFVAEMVRSEMVSRYGKEAYTSGYKVYTTIDSRLQTAANSAIRQALQAYDKRHGYRGIERHTDITNIGNDNELDELLKDEKVLADLLPAIATEIDEKSATIYIKGGERTTLDWKALSWAQPYVDENHRGHQPESAGAVIKPGDFIRVVKEQSKEGVGSWRLAQIPKAEGALVSLEPDDGAVIALVGGYDFYHSKFNRVLQAKRQPGSGFKAIIYSAALEAGFTPASLINDAPVVFDDPSLESAWRPENYSGKFFGPTRLRYALIKSRNLVSIRLLRSMGINHALQHAKRFGFNPDELPHNLSLALGSGAITPMQMATAYAVLANGGYRIEPYFIERIEGYQKEILFQANPPLVCEKCSETKTKLAPEKNETSFGADNTAEEVKPLIAPRVISPQNHYLMNSMMRDVITRGTARRARSLGRNDLAGKTGTTNDQRDAWFNGFNRSHVAIAWVGFDSSMPLGKGEVGGRAALPAWISYMQEALKGVEEAPLRMPPGMVTVRIDPKTGKRASVNQDDAIFEVFRSENAPTGSTDPQSVNNGTSGSSENSSSTEEEELF